MCNCKVIHIPLHKSTTIRHVSKDQQRQQRSPFSKSCLRCCLAAPVALLGNYTVSDRVTVPMHSSDFNMHRVQNKTLSNKPQLCNTEGNASVCVLRMSVGSTSSSSVVRIVIFRFFIHLLLRSEKCVAYTPVMWVVAVSVQD